MCPSVNRGFRIRGGRMNAQPQTLPPTNGLIVHDDIGRPCQHFYPPQGPRLKDRGEAISKACV